MFKFYDPDTLVKNDLELILVEKYLGDLNLGDVPAYKFKLIRQGSDRAIGHINLRIGNTHDIVMYNGHIGYSVHPDHRGHRLAARACRLVFPLAKQHGLKVLWITCDPDNAASRKTCEILGGMLVEIVDLPEDSEMYQDGERQKCRYRIEL
ncbi:GNAT family N-acetyltransferase [Cyanobacteria bacterium FACHB-63]|nr:GNAT family N-acetyltransferase [Cyanobacteria bacterium FACHB-63]